MATLPEETRIGRVALDVADLDRQASFYADAIGLAPLGREDGRATLGAGGDPLLELQDAAAGPRPRAAAGLFHVAYRVPSRAALAAALARIRESGRLSGASDHLVSEALYLDDPEHNGIEVYRDRPREQWDATPDGGVRMDTLPLDLEDLAAAADAGADAADVGAVDAGATGDAEGGRDGDAGAGEGGGGTTPATSDGTVPPGTRVGHVHLEVTDLDRARAFYVDALGFEVANRSYPDALFVAAGGYHHHVGLNVWNGRSAAAAGRGLAWFEVVVPDEAALERAVDRLDEAGYPVERADAGAAVEDPDGIELRLTAE